MFSCDYCKFSQNMFFPGNYSCVWFLRYRNAMNIRGGSRAAVTSKMERFVIIVNGFKPLTVTTKRSILDVAAALDPPLPSDLSIHGKTYIIKQVTAVRWGVLEFPRDRFSSQGSLQLILAIWLRKTIYRTSFNSRQPSKGYMMVFYFVGFK